MSPLSTADTAPISVQVAGPGPYGFRLLGGGTEPLVVAKLRPQSKSHDAGLREHDVILTINGRSCRALSHTEAARLLEGASIHLNLQVIRGAESDAVEAAFKNLESLMPEPILPTPAQPSSDSETKNPLPPKNGPLNQSQEMQKSEVQKEHEVENRPLELQETFKLRTTVETTTTEQHGGVTSTKITRHVVAETSREPPFSYYISEREREKQEFLRRCREHSQDLSPHRPAAMPYHQPQAISYQQSEAILQPEVAPFHQPDQMTHQDNNDAAIIVHHHISSTPAVVPHQPYLTNLVAAPYAATSSEGSISPFMRQYQPTPDILNRFGSSVGEFSTVGEFPLLPPFLPESYPRCQPLLVKFNVRRVAAEPWVWKPKRGGETRSARVVDDFNFGPGETDDEYYEEEIPEHSYSHTRNADGVRRHLGGVSPEFEEFDESYFLKNKVFVDPSISDHPEYATIKERIKMARRVAKSLTAPVNVAARGQRLFIHKQAEAGFNSDYHREPTEHDPHHQHHQAPWQRASRSKSPTPVSWEKKLEIPSVFKKDKADFRSKVRLPRIFEKRSSSADLERRKTTAVQSGELFANRGRGSRLFALRRAKSEEPEEYTPSFHLPKFGAGGHFNLEKISHQLAYNFPIFDREPTRHCRLHELIDEYNSRRSPWDRGDDYSSVGLFYESLNRPRRDTEWGSYGGFNPEENEQYGSTKFFEKTRDYFRPVRFKAPYGFGSMTLVASPNYTDFESREDDLPFTDF